MPAERQGFWVTRKLCLHKSGISEPLRSYVRRKIIVLSHSATWNWTRIGVSSRSEAWNRANFRLLSHSEALPAQKKCFRVTQNLCPEKNCRSESLRSSKNGQIRASESLRRGHFWKSGFLSHSETQILTKSELLSRSEGQKWAKSGLLSHSEGLLFHFQRFWVTQKHSFWIFSAAEWLNAKEHPGGL